MTNISQIMKQAKAMQEKMAEVQKKIEEAEVEGTSGGGAVKVLVNGKHNVKKITIDPSLVDKNEVEVLEDLLVAALNDATNKISENMSSQLSSISGGMDLPPGMKLPF
ncbi:MAG: YbaB/EbfC family nucleoid-associated protein [Rickettsiales bacterium]|nr:YbaB/EbfC family nucleoid-associated protein [Rickettsiales bacterium]